ncbi:MAG: tetratricopeptide repeat protein [Chryseotalea sp. WA131a]|jgi:tetratricopeptide (TPR) repeat protein|nr:MAG: tetratricopeptide repeat protein [Chryseotalea sp. WA131a]
MTGEKLLLIITIFCISSYSCRNKQAVPQKVSEKKISKKDSTRLISYLEKFSNSPLFSIQRQKYLDSALTITPYDAHLWQQKAMPLFKQKKYEIGMIYLDSAVKYDKTKHWLEYRAFIKCIFQKSYRAAITDFNLAQKQNGNSYVMDHSYQFYKGLCYLQLNQFDSAEYLIENEIKEEIKTRKEAHHLHWFYLGIVQSEKGNYKVANQSLDSCLHIYPQFPDAQYYKAQCLMRERKFKEAFDLLLSAKENLQNGYTLNEDNAIYEVYPYQINKRILNSINKEELDALLKKI